MRAIVYTGGGEAGVELADDVVLDSGLGPREVRVRIEASGVCGSDLAVTSGKIKAPTPTVLGHEGAGTVVEIGSAVTACAVGDNVVLSTLGDCGNCPQCGRGEPTRCGRPGGANARTCYSRAGVRLYQFAQTSCFAEETIVAEHQAVPIPREIPFAAAALIGCGVMTGVGAVFNRARVRPGDTVVVVGTGGVGLNVVQAATIAGARQVIAIDTAASKELLAVEFGATDFIHASDAEFDTVAAVEALRPGGVDHVFEVVGVPALLQPCLAMTAPGGNVIQVGVADMDSDTSYRMFDLYQNRSILGCRYGGARPRTDFPMIADLYLRGRLKIDELVTRTCGFDGVLGAFADIRSGSVARTVMRP